MSGFSKFDHIELFVINKYLLLTGIKAEYYNIKTIVQLSFREYHIP